MTVGIRLSLARTGDDLAEALSRALATQLRRRVAGRRSPDAAASAIEPDLRSAPDATRTGEPGTAGFSSLQGGNR